MDAKRGSVFAEADYILNVRKRLGARLYDACGACRLCGCPLDPQLDHSETCAIAEATWGHYAVMRATVSGFKLADPGITTEPRGLTSTQARPADILSTAAVPGRSAALDVCIASSNAAAAAGDAAEAAFKRKLRHYRKVIPELNRLGIAFRPLVWTADGRPHPAVTRTLRFAAEQAASRSGGTKATELRERWKHEIMVAILRRRAAMARSVMPEITRRQEWLRSGFADAEPDSISRLPLLDDPA